MWRLRYLAFLVALSTVLATACAPSPTAIARPTAIATAIPAHYPLTVVDDRGKSLTLVAAPSRIVSLAPSATEIVFALGAGDRIIATDDFSDFPAAAKAIQKIGGFRTSPEAVIAQRPDLILAISSGNLPAQLESLSQPLFVFDPSDLEGVYKNILAVGSLVDRDQQAGALVADMRSRIDKIGETARRATSRPRVLHEVDSTNPAQLFVAGPRNFIDSMITTVGGINVAADATVKFPKFSPEEIVARNPDIVVLADFRFGTTPAMVMARPGWSAINAVTARAIYPIDDDLVSRPGPRLVLGFEIYAKLVHPELFGRP
jgi:iron complex transport system substrate-binding protein